MLLLKELSTALRGKNSATLSKSMFQLPSSTDVLQAAGAGLVGPGTPKDAFNQAEGARYLTRMLRAGLMAFIEHCDPQVSPSHL